METSGNYSQLTHYYRKRESTPQEKFDEQGVYNCIKLCGTDKAAGPDRYTMDFYIKCWEVLKHHIMEAFHNFHAQEMFEKSFNATYIDLIPKKKGAKELKDFRPISLLGAFTNLF